MMFFLSPVHLSFTPTSTLTLALTLVTGSDLDVCDRGPRRGLTSLSTAAPLIFSLRTMVWRGGGLVVSTYCGRGFFSGGVAASGVEVARIGYWCGVSCRHVKG